MDPRGNVYLMDSAENLKKSGELAEQAHRMMELQTKILGTTITTDPPPPDAEFDDVETISEKLGAKIAAEKGIDPSEVKASVEKVLELRKAEGELIEMMKKAPSRKKKRLHTKHLLRVQKALRKQFAKQAAWVEG